MFYIYIKKEKPPDRMTLLMNPLEIGQDVKALWPLSQ